MAVGTAEEGCDAYSVVIFSDEGKKGLECEVPIDLSSPIAARNPLKSQLSLDARLSNQSYINMMVENAVAYSTCTVDVDIEKGNSETKSNEETLDDLKNEEVLTKSLQKQISFDMGGKYMQLLMNHSLMLSKFSTRDKGAAEKLLDAPRSRKYKRAASFNSRKVVLLFSVLIHIVEEFAIIQERYGFQPEDGVLFPVDSSLIGFPPAGKVGSPLQDKDFKTPYLIGLNYWNIIGCVIIAEKEEEEEGFVQYAFLLFSHINKINEFEV